MKAFLDTSSLLKLYHSETGSNRLIEILSEDIEAIYLSELAKIEFLSAIWKKVRQKEITGEIANSVISCFEEDFDKYQWILLSPAVIKRAGELVRNTILPVTKSLRRHLKKRVRQKAKKRGKKIFLKITKYS